MRQEIFIVAGEASGDQHAGALMRELGRMRPDLRFFGMGGEAMRAEGLEALFDSSEISVMGFTEVLPKLFRIFGVLRQLARAAKERRPALAILVDVPDFNLRLAKRLKKLGIPVVYYISPMLWASRPGRVKQIAARVDRMLCILPFEVEFYREHGVEARYVGNPLLDQIPQPGPVADFRRRLGAFPAPEGEVVALLPGSRRGEIGRVLPTLVESAKLLAKARPGVRFLLPVAPGLAQEELAPYFGESGIEVAFVRGRVGEVVGASDAAIVCSGTAALEAGLMLRPHVVVYRVSWPTWLILRMVLRIAHASLVNLLAGAGVVPELLQRDFTAERVAAKVQELMAPGAAREELVRRLSAVRERLGPSGASARAAQAVRELLE